MNKVTFEQYLKWAPAELGSYGLRRAVAAWALSKYTSWQRNRCVYGKTKYERACDFVVLSLTEFFSVNINETSPLHSNTARDAKRTATWMNRLSKLSYPQQRRLVQATIRDAVHLGMITETANGWAANAEFDRQGKTMVIPEAPTPSKMTVEVDAC